MKISYDFWFFFLLIMITIILHHYFLLVINCANSSIHRHLRRIFIGAGGNSAFLIFVLIGSAAPHPVGAYIPFFYSFIRACAMLIILRQGHNNSPNVVRLLHFLRRCDADLLRFFCIYLCIYLFIYDVVTYQRVPWCVYHRQIE